MVIGNQSERNDLISLSSDDSYLESDDVKMKPLLSQDSSD
jgi:hypothetical protein